MVLRSPYTVIVAAVLITTFFWHGFLRWMGISLNPYIKIVLFVIDLFFTIIVFFGLIYFFSQFVLPIRNPKDRIKIFKRVLALSCGKRGPAIFIKNGKIIEHEGERERKGAGVVLLDTASAAVLQTDVEFRETIGPGVKFTEVHNINDEKYSEYVTGSVDLRTQWKFIGPMAEDDVFLDPLPFEKNSPNEAMRRMNINNMTSGWTRDGFEVKATLSVKFRIKRVINSRTDSGVISRYGFDPNNVRKAIVYQPLELEKLQDKRELLPWDKLPEHLVINLWRESVGKFKLDELFSTKADKESGLQIIERKMTKRLQSPGFDPWEDVEGTSPDPPVESPEFKQLVERGIEILEVKIYNVQFEKPVEDKIVSQWSGEWLKAEKKEASSLDQKEADNEVNVPKDAVKDFARTASKHFADTYNPLKDIYILLQALIEPLMEAVKVKAPVDDEQKKLLQKLSTIWKWLLSNRPTA